MDIGAWAILFPFIVFIGIVLLGGMNDLINRKLKIVKARKQWESKQK